MDGRESGRQAQGERARKTTWTRWLGYGLTAAALAVLVVVPVAGLWRLLTPARPPTVEAARAIEGLRESSVDVEPGGAWTLDVAAARAVIGDRPILVAGFSDPARFDETAAVYREEIARYEGDLKKSLEAGYIESLLEQDVPLVMICRHIAAAYPEAIVVVIHPQQTFKRGCTGDDFPEAEYSSDPASWADGVVASAHLAAETRIRINVGPSGAGRDRSGRRQNDLAALVAIKSRHSGPHHARLR